LSSVSVEEATEVTPELLGVLAHLVPQLSQSAAPIGETELAEMVASPAVRLLVARLSTPAESGGLATAAESGGLATAAESGGLATAAESGDMATAAESGDMATAAESGDIAGIVGTLSLVLFRIPTGVRGWIEDVIVDDAVRGRGVGEALTAEAIRLADEAGARTLDLTSRPSRQAAHRLYSKLGFEVRDTSVYRLKQQR
jgi:ribosomal protein S18 acetylase RimI-like enzyme